MNIKTRYFVTNSVSWSILVLMSLFLWLGIRETKKAIKQNESADQIIQTVSKLRFAAVEYILYREKRPAQQWQKIYNSFTPQLAAAAAAADSPDSKRKFFLKRILENSRNTRILFFNLRLAQGDSQETNEKKQLLEEFNARTASQMMANLQLITNDAIQIGQISYQQVKVAQERVSEIILLCIILLGAILTIDSVFIRRSILRPLLKLKRATEGFASGELENIVDINTRDEVGDLSRSFNSMRIKLKEESEQRNKAQEQTQKAFAELKTSQVATLNIMEDLRESEERINLALEAAQMGAWDLDLVRDTAVRSLRHDQIFGYSRLQPEWGGKIFFNHVLPADQEIAKKSFDEASVTGFFKLECRIIWPDKSIHWISAFGQVYRNKDGDPTRMMGLVLDITERKRAQDEIQEKTEELSRSNQELEQFAYVASHDLQEPLRMVASFTQLLEQKYKDKLDEQAKEYIYFAADGAQRMQGLIDDLLMFSRVGQKDVPYSTIDLNNVCGNIMKDLDILMKENKANIQIEQLPILYANETQMTQLFLNLITNGIKYRSEKDPVVRVTSKELGNDYWQFSVSDNGIGIEEKYYDKLFVIFQRLHTRKEYKGTGIGLALCKKIVENNGGRIWLESKVDVGTTFYFTLKGGGQNAAY